MFLQFDACSVSANASWRLYEFLRQCRGLRRTACGLHITSQAK